MGDDWRADLPDLPTRTTPAERPEDQKEPPGFG